MASPDLYGGIDIPPVPAPLVPVAPAHRGLKSPDGYALPALKNSLRNVFAERLGIPPEQLPSLDPNPRNRDAELALPAHTLARQLRRSPVQIAEELAAARVLGADSTALNGFVNVRLQRDGFAARVLSDVESEGPRYGWQNIGDGSKVVIDYSSPNVAKPMSVGHLRSTAIGWSLAKIYEATGHETIKDNHLGDWGTQFGTLGKAFELWGHEIPEIRDGTDVIRGLFKLYVKMHDEINREKKLITAPLQAKYDAIQDKKSYEAKKLRREIDRTETPLEAEGRAWFKRLEDGDEKAKALLDWASELSKAELARVYDLLGVRFNYALGESQYVGMLPSMLAELSRRGITSEHEGAISVDLQHAGLERLVLRKRDEASVYATRDLATIIARDVWFSPDKILYVVGADQGPYFEQLFASYRALTNGQGPELHHVAFGAVTLPEGKMSTRAGRVIFLEEVLHEAIERAKKRIDNDALLADHKQRDMVAKQVGVGAVVYWDLGQGSDRSIEFDWDQVLSLEGQSGPYLQYAHARAGSLFARVEQAGVVIDPSAAVKITTPVEFGLVTQIAKFPEAVAAAQADNEPSKIAQATYNVAAALNQFHRADRVLGSEDPVLSTRMRLVSAAGQTIENGLNLLGIEAPGRM
jgi:arginyl-tRNA synthetase